MSSARVKGFVRGQERVKGGSLSCHCRMYIPHLLIVLFRYQKVIYKEFMTSFKIYNVFIPM